MSDVADNVLAKTNTARSHGRNPTLEELGGEETLLRHGAELASSEVAGTACLTIANRWDLVAEQDMALAFFGMAFRACGDSVVSEVVEAIATLPTMKAAQVAPALFHRWRRAATKSVRHMRENSWSRSLLPRWWGGPQSPRRSWVSFHRTRHGQPVR